MTSERTLMVALAGTFGLVVACAVPASMPMLEEAESFNARETFVIGVTDQLLINVWKNPELSSRLVVRSDGMISVPLLDDVQAEGLTAEELKEVITEALSEYISNPDVTVVVIGMNSNTISIMGGVNRQGELSLQKETRVLQAIARSGGFSVWAKQSQVKILRQTEHGLVEYRFDYDAYLAGKAPGTNLVLKAGDTIVVPD
ncbi:MAG: polysaccharide biosynthesis/export family protein [Myxococcota bacterium]